MPIRSDRPRALQSSLSKMPSPIGTRSVTRQMLASLGAVPQVDIADGLQIDKSRKLTADDGKLLGAECRHAPKAKVDVAVIAEAKRREAKFHDFSRPKQTVKSPGLAKSEMAAKQCRTRDCRNCRDGRFTRGLSRE